MRDAQPGFWALAGAFLKISPLILVFLALAPVQWLAVQLNWAWMARRVPLLFHRVALWCLGVRVRLEGAPVADGPVLLVGNHISWLDIVIVGSLMPVRFVSKDDVASWPVFGTLARLQRTLFVSRTRRAQTGQTAREMEAALAARERLVLFPEGTSSDGGHVLPFKSALLGAVIGGGLDAQVQSFAIAYVRRDGLPITRGERATLGWYGDLELLPSLLEIIHGGPLDVAVVMNPSEEASAYTNRKVAARALEATVRQSLATRLRAG